MLTIRSCRETPASNVGPTEVFESEVRIRTEHEQLSDNVI